jgi:hypothetical protein
MEKQKLRFNMSAWILLKEFSMKWFPGDRLPLVMKQPTSKAGF